jgi:hypothetical protein
VRAVVDSALGRTATHTGASGIWAGDRALGARIDALDLPPGSVLADTDAAFAVVAASDRPDTFLLTSADGADATLADPRGHGIRLVLRNEECGVDAVRETWPDLGSTGWVVKVTTSPASRSGRTPGPSGGGATLSATPAVLRAALALRGEHDLPPPEVQCGRS